MALGARGRGGGRRAPPRLTKVPSVQSAAGEVPQPGETAFPCRACRASRRLRAARCPDAPRGPWTRGPWTCAPGPRAPRAPRCRSANAHSAPRPRSPQSRAPSLDPRTPYAVAATPWLSLGPPTAWPGRRRFTTRVSSLPRECQSRVGGHLRSAEHRTQIDGIPDSWDSRMEYSVPETAPKQAAKPWSSTMRVPGGQGGDQGPNGLWGVSGDSVQWHRYGVP